MKAFLTTLHVIQCDGLIYTHYNHCIHSDEIHSIWRRMPRCDGLLFLFLLQLLLTRVTNSRLSFVIVNCITRHIMIYCSVTGLCRQRRHFCKQSPTYAIGTEDVPNSRSLDCDTPTNYRLSFANMQHKNKPENLFLIHPVTHLQIKL